MLVLDVKDFREECEARDITHNIDFKQEMPIIKTISMK
jgi:hypothetical protein